MSASSPVQSSCGVKGCPQIVQIGGRWFAVGLIVDPASVPPSLYDLVEEGESVVEMTSESLQRFMKDYPKP